MNRTATRRPPISVFGAVTGGIGWLTCLFLLLPFIVVVPISFGAQRHMKFPPTEWTLGWYAEYFGSDDWLGATLFSFQIGLLSALVTTALGTMATYAMLRSRVPGRQAVNLLLLAPLIVPNIALAIADYFVFARLGMLGSVAAFVAAHCVLSMPFVVLTVTTAMMRVDVDLELASMSLGASRTRAFFDVVLPLAWPGILAGFLFAFIMSFDESVISFFISGDRQKTLPRRMFEDIDQNISPVLAAIAVLLTAMSVVIVVLGQWLQNRRRQAGAGAD